MRIIFEINFDVLSLKNVLYYKTFLQQQYIQIEFIIFSKANKVIYNFKI